MEQKKHVKKFILLLLIVIAPLLLAVLLYFVLPKPYGETFLGELGDKYERLTSLETPKIVVIGGSSVAFGLDSELLTEETGYETVNFGLYATLGTKLMLDLSEAGLKEGDIVILAPEPDAQTMSLYFNGTAALQGLESNPRMLLSVKPANYGDLLASLFDYLGDRVRLSVNGLSLDGETVYRRDSFNELGDISIARPYNTMTLGYDANHPVALDESIFSEDFVDYVNDYIRRAEKKGVKVFFSFAPVDRLAVEGLTEEDYAAYFRLVSSLFDAEVISDPRRAVMDDGYFFDTNFHLNDSGVRAHTMILASDILRTLGRTDSTLGALPAPTGRKPQEDTPETGEDPWEKYFVYEDFGSALKVVGVTEEGRKMEQLSIPKRANERPVYVLGENTFSGCDRLREVTVFENLSLIEDGAFNGASGLQKLHLRRENADNLEVGSGLLTGTDQNLTICLYTETSYAHFMTGYFFSAYADRMRLMREGDK